MKLRSTFWPAMIAGSLGLGGCTVLPADDYGYYGDGRYYAHETVIVTPPPRIEYRGLPPAAGYLWIDGYWNRIGPRPYWVPGYWRAPAAHPRPAGQHPPRHQAHPDGGRDRRDAHDRDRWRDAERWRERDGARGPGGVPGRALDRDPPRPPQGARPAERTPEAGRPDRRPAGSPGEVREARRDGSGARVRDGFRAPRRDDGAGAQASPRRERDDAAGRPGRHGRAAADD